VDELEKNPHGQAAQRHRHFHRGGGGGGRRDRRGATGEVRGGGVRRDGGRMLAGDLVEEEEVKNAITELKRRLSEIRAANSGAPSSSISSAPARTTHLDRQAPTKTRLDRCGPGQPSLYTSNKIASSQNDGAVASKGQGTGRDSAPHIQAARPVQNLQSFVEELEEGME